MTKYYKYSKRLHWATLCCFLFPFFYTGCGPSAEEKATKEKAMQDSSAVYDAEYVKALDSVTKEDSTLRDLRLTKSITTYPTQNNISQVDTLKEQASNIQSETTASKPEKESKNLSEKISSKFPFLKLFLVADS